MVRSAVFLNYTEVDARYHNLRIVVSDDSIQNLLLVLPILLGGVLTAWKRVGLMALVHALTRSFCQPCPRSVCDASIHFDGIVYLLDVLARSFCRSL